MSGDRPEKLRVLAILTGPTAEAVVDGERRGLGAVEELFEMKDNPIEVRARLQQGPHPFVSGRAQWVLHSSSLVPLSPTPRCA